MKPRLPRSQLNLKLLCSHFMNLQTIPNMADKSTYSTGALSFELKDISSSDCVQRLGKLKRKERIPIDTPHYFPISSRGFVPHLSQDIVRDKTSIKGIYLALEDSSYRENGQSGITYLHHIRYV